MFSAVQQERRHYDRRQGERRQSGVPVADERRRQERRRGERRHRPLPPATILVVEDDADTREFYEVLLVSAGYKTLLSDTVLDALGYVADQHVDAVLLDRRLPDMDGIAVCRYLRDQLGPDVPIIMMTAEQGSEIEAEARAAGATDFFRKPFAPEALIDRIAARLRRSVSDAPGS